MIKTKAKVNQACINLTVCELTEIKNSVKIGDFLLSPPNKESQEIKSRLYFAETRTTFYMFTI